MKKILIKSVCLLLVTITTFSLCGCLNIPKEFDAGDFRVSYLSKDAEKDPNSYLCVLGLSETGQKKKTIVLPKKINGRTYRLRFKQVSPMFGFADAGFIGEMEKIYFGYPGKYSAEDDRSPDINVSRCKNLQKVFLNVYVGASSQKEVLHYYNYLYYDYMLNHDGLLDSKILDNNYISETTEGENNWIVKGKVKLANLQYMYNFEGAENYGHYWIDDIDNGEKIEIMPDTPEREGYTFGGWYTEEECINEFDFNTVFNKPVLEKGDTYPKDYVTYLYAKWIPVEG